MVLPVYVLLLEIKIIIIIKIKIKINNNNNSNIGRHEDRPTNMDQEAAHEEPTSLLEVAIGWAQLTEGKSMNC